MREPEEEQRYRKLRVQLQRTVSRICPRWLADSREDIVQTAIIRVLRQEEKSEGKEPFNPHHIRRLCYCALVDEIRHRRSLREVPITDRGAEPAETRRSLTPGPKATAMEIERGITDCLGELARNRRIAVTLYLQGHSVPDLARSVRWSHKKAENLVYRGLATLRACLASKGLRP